MMAICWLQRSRFCAVGGGSRKSLHIHRPINFSSIRLMGSSSSAVTFPTQCSANILPPWTSGSIGAISNSSYQYMCSNNLIPSSHLPLQSNIKLYFYSSSSRGGGRIPRMSECRTLDEAMNATYDNLDRLSPRDVSAFWAVVPKLLKGGRYNHDQMKLMFHQFDVISTKSIKEIERYEYRDLATLAISLAKIIDKVERSGNRKGAPQQILQDILIGNNSEIKQFIFNRLADASVPILYEFDARHLSNLIYAFGLAKVIIPVEDGTTYFDMLAEVAIQKIKDFNSHDISNMLWAYANVGVTNTTLFAKAGETIIAMEHLDEFWPQHLSNIVWAYATLNEKNPELFKKVADHIAALDNSALARFDPQALSNIVWAYATAQESHPQLFKKVAEHTVTLDNLALARFDPQHLSNIVWAYATAEESHPKLFEKVADNIVSLNNLDKFDEQHLSNIPWAYATAGVSHLKLFRKLAVAAIKRQHEFNSQGIANFLWTYATNGEIEQTLFSSLTPAVKANLDKYIEQNLANIAWAYAVADVAAPSVFDDKFLDVCIKKEDEFIVDELNQLHQWQLWQKELQSNVQLPQSLQRKCYDAFISRVPRPSKLQDDVTSELTSIGLEPEEEVLTKSGYRLDAVVEVNGKQVGVEVDGPSHFIGRQPKGRTMLKHRQVPNLDGIPLVSVPYWEWNKLKKDSQKKQQYLRALLGLD